MGKLVHEDFAKVVGMVFRKQAGRGPIVVPHLTIDTAYEYADNLHKGRMEADYRPYLNFSKIRAQQLIMQAHTLTQMLVAEAEFIQSNQKQQTSRKSEEGAAS